MKLRNIRTHTAFMCKMLCHLAAALVTSPVAGPRFSVQWSTRGFLFLDSLNSISRLLYCRCVISIWGNFTMSISDICHWSRSFITFWCDLRLSSFNNYCRFDGCDYTSLDALHWFWRDQLWSTLSITNIYNHWWYQSCSSKIETLFLLYVKAQTYQWLQDQKGSTLLFAMLSASHASYTGT